MSRAIDRYINESILRRSGGVREFWGGLKILLGHFYELLIICLESWAQAQSIGTLLGDLIKGGRLGVWS
jgi:hypothetical protein